MSITFAIIAKDEADIISGCLNSLKGQEVIVISDNSNQETLKIIERYENVTTINHSFKDFSKQRNFAVSKVNTDWVFFIDTDERLSKKAIKEITTIIKDSTHSAYKLKRLNYFFGEPLKNGGYWPDWQTRLFKIKSFNKYTGTVHESPQYQGTTGQLKNHLVHFSHKGLIEGLKKSIVFTQKEAEAFIKAGHPKITSLRIIKVMLFEFFFRYFKKKAFLNGYTGFTESLIQAINRYFVYQQIWEMQQTPSIQEKYQQLDEKIK